MAISYRATLAASVPVPAGWSVGEYQGTAVTVMSPPCFIPHGPRFTVERLEGVAPTGALEGRCSVQPPDAPPVEGPMDIAGHPASYQYLCQPRSFLGIEWTVLIPQEAGQGTWRLTYLGAGQKVGQGALAKEFTTVLKAFRP